MVFRRLALPLLLASLAGSAQAIPLLDFGVGPSGFGTEFLPDNDDQSTGRLSLPFEINFFGQTFNNFFVNNNGNITFTSALGSFTPQPFPVSAQPLAFLQAVQPQVWGAEIFKLGLWVALPVVSMLLLVNMVLGLIARVSPQMNVFTIGFPITLTVGFTGLWLTLPMMEVPLTMALERMMGYFQ